MSDEVQEIKNRLDIVDLIQEYLPLKKAGKDWKACCPFHQEKTPSFMVSRDKQIFYCFGCSKGGDMFTFVEEVEGLDFVEVLKLLADKTGVTLSERRSEVSQSQKNRLLEINACATSWFNAVLTKHPLGGVAFKYLKDRGLTDETIKEFNIGFAPDSWDSLSKTLLKRGFGIDDIVAAGLVIKKDGAAASGRGFYDRFRGRIMFPISNVQGQVIGFTGRILIETENTGGKYVNTPQTKLYDKSNVLYGIDKARQEARSKDFMVIVEGQMDVISCNQAGMQNVVAASGTALTTSQVNIIKRYTSNIRVAFDEDAAGIAAAKRGMDVALQQGLSVKVIQIPKGYGKDPDDCIKKDKAVWFKSVDEAVDIMEFYFSIVLPNDKELTPSAKKLAADELLEQISKIPSAVLRDHWIQKLSERLRVISQALREDLVQVVKRTKTQTRTSEEAAPNPILKKIRTRHEKLSEAVLGTLVAFGLPESGVSALEDQHFASPQLGTIYNQLILYYTNHNSASAGDFLNFIQAGEKAMLYATAAQLSLRAETHYQNLGKDGVEKDRASLINSLLQEYNNQRKVELTSLIKEAEQGGDRDQMMNLLRELQNLAGKT